MGRKGIFTYHEWLTFMVNVGKYTSPMDAMGYIFQNGMVLFNHPTKVISGDFLGPRNSKVVVKHTPNWCSTPFATELHEILPTSWLAIPGDCLLCGLGVCCNFLGTLQGDFFNETWSGQVPWSLILAWRRGHKPRKCMRPTERYFRWILERHRFSQGEFFSGYILEWTCWRVKTQTGRMCLWYVFLILFIICFSNLFLCKHCLICTPIHEEISN